MVFFGRIRFPWRRAAAGVLLALAALGGVWRWVDQRLAEAAPDRAAAGESLAVIALREDWPRSVGSAALSAPGDAGERARRLANARLDLAISRSLRGEPEVFRSVAKGLLGAIRETQPPFTPSGVAWARWIATRLTESSRVLEASDRFELLTLADDAMGALATKPRIRQPLAEPPPPEPVVATPPVEKPPLPTLVEAVAAPPRDTPDELPSELLTDGPPPAEPSPWRPAWSKPAPKPVATEPVINVPPPAHWLTDRQLLARLLEANREVAAARALEAMVAGPVSAPRGDDQPTGAEGRLETLRLEVAKRGYQAVGAEHVEALLSPDESVRLALVERLLTDHVASAARLLLLLTSDASGEVRAAAVSALGSTTNQALVRAALEVAIRDRDPRVGRLAGQLRERLR